jgi:ribosomal protein L11 methyltransferase
MEWLAVRVAGAHGDARDAITSALIAAGAAGVQEVQDALVTYVPDDAPLASVRDLVSRDAAIALEVLPAQSEDVDRQWPTDVRLSRVGRLVVSPPWLAHEIAPEEIGIVIEPATAFGTGEHPTTRGVLRLMQDAVRPGDRVADLGAGSAVLAIAAAKLGATRVAAIEVDSDAISNAELNVAANDVGDRVIVIEGDAALLLPLVAPVRVVLANIVSSVIETLLPAIGQSLSTDGVAILSGMLSEERDDFCRVLDRQHWRIVREHVEDSWWTVVARPA